MTPATNLPNHPETDAKRQRPSIEPIECGGFSTWDDVYTGGVVDAGASKRISHEVIEELRDKVAKIHAQVFGPPIEPAGDKAFPAGRIVGPSLIGTTHIEWPDGGTYDVTSKDDMIAANKRLVAERDAVLHRLGLAGEAIEAGITVMEALADIVDAATKDKEISRNLQGLAWMVDRSDRAVTVWRDKLKAFREGPLE